MSSLVTKLSATQTIESLSQGGGANNGRSLIRPYNGAYYSYNAVETGYLKITLPQSWNNNMIMMTIDIYMYNEGMVTLRLGGYPSSSGSAWAHTQTHIVSTSPHANIASYKIEYGHDGSLVSIYVSHASSGASSTWVYPQVVIRDVNLGFTTISDSMANAWDIEFTATLGTITATKTLVNKSFILGGGDGAANKIAYWSDTETLSYNTNLTYSGGKLIVGPSAHVVGDISISTDGVDNGLSIYNGTGTTLRIWRSGDIGYITRGSSGTSGLAINASGNIGIGTVSPSYKLDVTGTARITSAFHLTGISAGTDNTVLILNGSGQVLTDEIDPRVWGASLTDGSGTLNYISKWTAGSTLGNSQIFDNGTNVGIGTASPAYKLDISGRLRNTGFRDLGLETSYNNASATSAGWYPIGRWSGSRGGHRIYISYTGGNWSPVTYEIEVYKSWTTDVSLKTKQFGSVGYITDARIIGNTGDTVYYLEVYLPANANGHLIYLYRENIGYHDELFLFESSLALSTNTGTVLVQKDFYQNSTIDDYIGVSSRIFHDGDTDTYLSFASDSISLFTGGIENIKFNSSETVLNDGSADLNFRIESNNDANAFYVDGGTDNIGIGTVSPSYKLDVIGAIRTTTNLLIGQYLFHDGDADTYLDFYQADGLRTVIGGVETIRTNVTETVINEVSVDHNFRVESNNDTHCLFVDGGNDTVGIGAVGASTVKLSVESQNPAITANGTNYYKATYSSIIGGYNINTGITDSGYRIALDASAYVVDTDFKGTLATQYAIWARHGANVSTAGSVITNSYGVYIDSLSTANTTITNFFGLYQASTSAKNYFGGNVGIGTASPSYKLDVSGTARVTGYLYAEDRLYVDNTTNYLSYPTGTYGSIQINGDGVGAWEGFSIDGRAVFMHDGSTGTGLYNDVDNEWLFYAIHNGETRMYHNGVACIVTTGSSSATIGGNTIWHSGNDGTGSGLDADTLDNRQLNTLSATLRANRALTGGGTITFDATGRLLWSTRFIVISNGRGSHFSTTGYFEIACPTSGTITGVGGAANVTATAAGILMGSWHALYYILPIGASNTSVAANFRIVSYTSDLEIPDDWVLIAINNSDTGQGVYLNNGYRLELNQSIDTTVFDSKNSDLLDSQEGSYYLDYNNFSNTPTIGNGTITVTASTGLSGSSSFTLNQAGNTTITLTNTGVLSVNGVTGAVTAANLLTALLTVDGAGSTLDADTIDGIDGSDIVRITQTQTITGTKTFSDGPYLNGTLYWRVSSVDAAIQRVDARDDATNYSRLHWYGMTDTGVTSNFRHAWYDGSAYINIDVSSSNINFARTSGTANLQVHGNTVWHAGNDGTGSTLDADLLDGIDSGSFLRSDATDTATGLINFNAGATITSNAEGAFILKRLTTSTTGDDITHIYQDDGGIHFVIDNDNDSDTGNFYVWYKTGGSNASLLAMSPTTFTYKGSTIWHSGNDGASSTLDADLLDGQHGSYYSDYNNLTNKPTIPTISGVTNYIPKYTGTTVLGYSIIYDDGTNIGVGTTSPAGYKLNVNGSLRTASDASFAGNISAVQSITATGTITFSGLGAGTDNTVVILNGSNQLKTAEIDSRVWGSTLVGGSGSSNYIPKWTAGNTIGNSILHESSNSIGVLSNTNGIFRNDHILSAGGGRRSTGGTSADIGYIKISLPVSWTNTMVSMWIDVFEYSTYRTCSFYVAGYTYATGTAWVNTSATMVGEYLNTNVSYYAVEFAHDGSKCCIYISKTSSGASSSWSYPYITVRDVTLNHSGNTYSSWDDGWAVSTTDAGTGKVTSVTHNVYQPITRANVSGTTSYVPKFTGSNTIGNSIIYDNATNVGIGTASPAYKLDVNGTLNFGAGLYSNTKAVIETLSSGTDVYVHGRIYNNVHLSDGTYLNYNSAGTTAAHLRFYANGTTLRGWIDASTGNWIIGSGAANTHKLLVEGTTKINTSLGINGDAGTHSSKLHIVGDASNPVISVSSAAVDTSTSSSGRAFVGWLPIKIEGTTRWIKYYA